MRVFLVSRCPFLPSHIVVKILVVQKFGHWGFSGGSHKEERWCALKKVTHGVQRYPESIITIGWLTPSKNI